ncbi:MAG TPA: polyprenyl synthetase family protein [Pyrinomonadaceae bacterium]|nr:polyprenyl synthetase family protein [Pyrinomonadaceae bacterium]
MSDINQFLEEAAGLVNAELDRLIPAVGRPPQRLRDAIRWSLFAGGKRLRPALMLAAGRAFGAADEKVLPTAAAVEMIHTYSLIHDDLPSMDDDDLRRGRETCHKKYGEATAILAGDALQALAFQTIAEDAHNSPETKMRLISGLGQAAACMVVGQQLDLEAEGRALSIGEIENIHINKTGALIAFSTAAGAIVAGASQVEEISAFGEKIGLLFQVMDDLLDVTQSTADLGKTAGKDAESEKATYPSSMGVEGTRNFARKVYEDAIAGLSEVKADTSTLKEVARFLLERRA